MTCVLNARKASLLCAVELLLAAGALFATAFSARAADSDVLRAQLDNGLRVVIVRNTLAPVVATSVNYLAGSDETPAGFPGTAHAQEHMMFRGSPGLSADQLAALGSAMGGAFNANTRESLTQYLYTVPAEDLDVALHIEAIRMGGVLDSAADWEHERGAIEQEVAQDLSSPQYVLYAKLRAALFSGTPYEHDALGTRESFDKTDAQALKHFYDTWYAPNNAILVIVGNVDPSKTLVTVKELFGEIPRKKLPARPAVKLEPVHADRISVDTDRPNGTQMLAIRLPGLDSPDFPALELLADVLDSQRFALYGLVPQGKAIAAGFSLDPLPRAGMAYAAVSFTSGTDPEALDHDIRDILAAVVKNGVPEELVAAAKREERRQAEFQKNSVDGLASVWADAIALYGLDSPDEDLARIEKVTVADINRVARKYLDLEHAISATMLPHGSGRPVRSAAGFGGQETIALGEATNVALPAWAETAVTRLSVPTSTVRPTVTMLPNGMKLIVQTENVSDTVSVYGHIKNRPDVEVAPGKEGVAEILDQLFEYGSEHLDRLALQQALDDIGAREQAGTDFGIEVLSPDFERGIELVADNELHPALPQQAFDILKSQYGRLVAARDASPGYLAGRSLRAALFPATRPELAGFHGSERRRTHARRRSQLLRSRIQAGSRHDRRDRERDAGSRTGRDREALRELEGHRPHTGHRLAVGTEQFRERGRRARCEPGPSRRDSRRDAGVDPDERRLLCRAIGQCGPRRRLLLEPAQRRSAQELGLGLFGRQHAASREEPLGVFRPVRVRSGQYRQGAKYDRARARKHA